VEIRAKYPSQPPKFACSYSYGALTDELLMDRILLGTKLEQVRRRLLSETDLTLQKARRL